MSDKVTLIYENGHGRTVSREVKLVANARMLEGFAGYPWAILLANPQLSSADIQRFLDDQGPDGAQRSLSWIQRHRWMTRPAQAPGPPMDRDGKYARAVKIMAENPKLSAPRLVFLLRDHGIERSREWVRQHRCDGMA